MIYWDWPMACGQRMYCTSSSLSALTVEKEVRRERINTGVCEWEWMSGCVEGVAWRGECGGVGHVCAGAGWVSQSAGTTTKPQLSQPCIKPSTQPTRKNTSLSLALCYYTRSSCYCTEHTPTNTGANANARFCWHIKVAKITTVPHKLMSR